MGRWAHRSRVSSLERVAGRASVDGREEAGRDRGADQCGAFAPVQERAPRALREAGLLDALRAADVAVRDYGDREI